MMLKRLLAIKFFQPYKIYANEEANCLYLMYLFGLGGLITDRVVSRRLKLMYALWVIVSFLVLFVPSTLYIYEQLRSNTLKIELIFSALTCGAIPCALVALLFLTFIDRENLTTGIKMMSIDFGIGGTISTSSDLFDQVASLSRKKFNVWDWFPIISCAFFLWVMSVACLRYVSHFFLEDRTSAYNNFYYWMIPVWKMGENESFTIYTTITVLQVILASLAIFQGGFYCLFFFWSGEILANYLIQIACTLETESSHARISLQSIDTRLLSEEISQETAQIMKNRVSQEIIRSGVRFIQNYRKLRKAIEYWKFSVEVSFEYSAMVNFVIFPATIFQIQQAAIPVPFKIAVSGWLVPLITVGFACCHFGRVMDDAKDILNTTLYNVPWYEIPPAKSKFMHLLMCELRESPITLTSFVIYPLTTDTFLQIIKANYFIVQVIRLFIK